MSYVFFGIYSIIIFVVSFLIGVAVALTLVVNDMGNNSDDWRKRIDEMQNE